MIVAEPHEPATTQHLCETIMLNATTVPVDKLLMGGECGLTSTAYATSVGDLTRPSRSVMTSPHLALLREAINWSQEDFQSEKFKLTAYYRNAAECLSKFGYYFPYIRSADQIWQAAYKFVDETRTGRIGSQPPGHSAVSSLVSVTPIVDSDCYNLFDGHHRTARAIYRGQTEIEVEIRDALASKTPIQTLLQQVRWDSKGVLYQPLPFPELTKSWKLLRRCDDRAQMMVDFTKLRGVHGSYLDLAAYFGYFCDKFYQAGFVSVGIELDPAAVLVGRYTYPHIHLMSGNILETEQITDKFDVVSCLSFLHHFISGRIGQGKTAMPVFLKSLDTVCREVLFVETGESTEPWFKGRLSKWTDDDMIAAVLENTTFKTATKLGRDRDGELAGIGKGNYGRMMVAFTR